VTAREVIEQIKTLSPKEQAEVLEFVEDLEVAKANGRRQTVCYVDDKTFTEAAKHVMEEHAPLLKKLAS